MRQYSLEDQYRIFRYGNDRREPPDLALVTPLAEKGAEAIPFLTEQLKSSTDDLAVRDIMYILEDMLRLKTYDVKADTALLNILDGRISTMKSRYLQAYARGKLLLFQDRSYTRLSPERTSDNPNEQVHSAAY
jgi:hypothetical protein